MCRKHTPCVKSHCVWKSYYAACKTNVVHVEITLARVGSTFVLVEITLRVEITFWRIGIILERVEITLVSVILTRMRVKFTIVCVESTLCVWKAYYACRNQPC
jgi:hypothetical protein